MARVLLLGAGHSRERRVRWPEGSPNDFEGDLLETLDHDETCNPTHLWDLERLPLSHPPSDAWKILGVDPKQITVPPLPSDAYDELHAYEVLEHTGKQGDWRFFFAQWAEFYRILRPGGYFVGTTPHYASAWAWGDPSHTRIVGPEQLVFLDQEAYRNQVGRTPMTDFRRVWKGDFSCVRYARAGELNQFVLQAHKPVRA